MICTPMLEVLLATALQPTTALDCFACRTHLHSIERRPRRTPLMFSVAVSPCLQKVHSRSRRVHTPRQGCETLPDGGAGRWGAAAAVTLCTHGPPRDRAHPPGWLHGPRVACLQSLTRKPRALSCCTRASLLPTRTARRPHASQTRGLGRRGGGNGPVNSRRHARAWRPSERQHRRCHRAAPPPAPILAPSRAGLHRMVAGAFTGGQGGGCGWVGRAILMYWELQRRWYGGLAGGEGWLLPPGPGWVLALGDR